MEIYELIGHHLRAVEMVHEKSRGEVEKILEEWGYESLFIPRKPFIDTLYDKTREIFSNSDNYVRFIESKKDYMCKACPKKISCFLINILSFLDFLLDFPEEDKDENRKVPKQYGFEIGQVYSVGEIKNVMNSKRGKIF